METEFQKIIRKTGRKPSNCKCGTCQEQCETHQCLGTPADIEKIIDAGHREKIKPTKWGVANFIVNGDMIPMFQAEFIPDHGCVFYEDGLCTLHEVGLKPTEGKLSHHTIKDDNYNRRKHLAYNIAKTWDDPANTETIKRIIDKMQP